MTSKSEFHSSYCPDPNNSSWNLEIAHRHLHEGDVVEVAKWIRVYLLTTATGVNVTLWNFIVKNLIPDHNAQLEVTGFTPPQRPDPIDGIEPPVSMSTFGEGNWNDTQVSVSQNSLPDHAF
ncbi:MAG TPA: hypothetical protein VK338_02640 [Candidatus Nitrosocosmicus sp.]|nr:hypothetical protein [Candidatus Nitrosocosmicus sp.]